MGQHILPGDPPVELVLRRSARARRISLRISGLDGRVTLTLPHGVSEAQGLDFARQKAGWMRKHLAQQVDDVAVVHGAELPFAGEMLRIVPGEGRRLRYEDGALAVPGQAEDAGPKVRAWLKAQARDRLAAASDRYAAQLGRRYNRISLRDTRSRWGSCTTDGGLMYSWRLIMAPVEVLDYVAAHEVAHLVEMNHSAAFWAQVEGLMPGYQAPRRWLRDHGAGLHRFRFGD